VSGWEDQHLKKSTIFLSIFPQLRADIYLSTTFKLLYHLPNNQKPGFSGSLTEAGELFLTNDKSGIEEVLFLPKASSFRIATLSIRI